MLERRSALCSVAVPGRHGAVLPEGPGLHIAEIRRRHITQLAGWPGSFATVLNRLPGLIDDRQAVIPVGADRVWIVGEGAGLAGRLRDVFASDEAVVLDLSQSRTVLAVDGPRVRDVLAKGFPIDLHPDTFPEGASAQTVVDHVGVLVRRAGVERFEIFVPRSYAASFWHWLTGSAAAFGYLVTEL